MKRIIIALFLMILAQSGKAQNLTSVENRSNEQIYTLVDVAAAPEGGIQKFYSDFAKAFKTLNVPNSSIVQLRIMLTFVVEKDGSFTEIKALRDPGFGAGTEAIRVMQSMPRWIPGLLEGRPVRCKFSLPITVRVR